MKKLILLVAFACVGNAALSSHLRCGYITVTRESCTSRNVFIIISVFTNTASDVRFGEDGILSFGDGNTMVVEGKDHIARPDLGPHVGEVRAIISYSYAATGAYLVSYVEPNRNGGVLNMTDSFNTMFYTETKFDFATCPSSSQFMAVPIFSGFTNSELSFSLGASSPNDNLITYEMGVPFRDRGLPVFNYWEPEGIELNELTGLFSWNTATANPGEYNFAVIAFQWVLENEQYKKVGFVRIDFQIILNENTSLTPTLLYDDQEFDDYNRVLVKPGEEKTIEIFYEPASGIGTMEMFSELTDESVSFSSQEVESGTFKGTLTLSPQEADQRTHGYIITIRGKSSGSASDRNYLVYTDEVLDFSAFDPVTGVEKDIAEVDIFPNPVQNQLNVQVNRPGKSEALLLTAQGKLVKTIVFESKATIMLTDLPAGVYICDIRRNNIPVKRIKLIKAE